MIIKVSAILLTLLTVSALVRWAYRQAFYENSEFRLNRFVVQTDGVLSEADVADAARVELGMNLMTIDLKSVRERLAELPMVTSVEVNRELPDRLEVKIEERVPLAWLSCPPHGVRPRNTARGFLIDEQGEVFRCQKLLKRFLDLPVIETYHLPKPSEGAQMNSDEVKEAIRLVKESNQMFANDGLEVAEVRIRNAYSLTCRYNTQMEVTFGLKELDRGLQDLRWIVTHAHSAGQQLATVNVMPSRNIPVTFYTPSAIQATPFQGVPGTLRALPSAAVGIDPNEARLQRQLRSILNGG
ncbi:MAG: FtsQ-type POTRA domain-containing protein [Verrucomicrobiae bacterium]|nr:FtsQ-type POTRA domain-containing protein [Verrucomicrobiae bacterium]MCB1236539.1 FtsQ-type POTRA domain-containing protein [Verrucomicrobiae bacterium]